MARADVVRHYGGISADERRAERRRKLLDAAREMWGAQGISEVTVRGICAAAGLTPRYFYEQFESRETLLLAVDAEVHDELIGVLVPASDAEAGGLDRRLRAALLAFLEMVTNDPHAHRIITSDPSGVAGLAAQRRAGLQRVTQLVIENSTGLLPSAPPADEIERLALFTVGGINSLIEDWLQQPRMSAMELADVCTRFASAAVTGLR
ncbi:MAG TPA: TetR/AcrR family transcriptional regulator [Marmoricola sp.]|nr:TetR/AcrR family transcriptional regulator [Marmoricola sp.]